MDYIIGSTAVTDELHFPNGEVIKNLGGGAGIYALAGIKLWWDNVEIITGVGKDYLDIYGDWYKENNLSTNGLDVRTDKTPHTVINYFEDGERVETPLYGPEHYLKVEVKPEDLEKYFKFSKGIYIFKNSNEQFWNKILKMKEYKNAKVMWEIANDAIYYENKDNIKEIAKRIDIFSINRSEAFNLMGTEDIEVVIEEFKNWNIPLIFLRKGKEGASLISKGKVYEAPSLKNIKVIDATGGGNSSSGAVLCGFCEGKTPLEAGIMGSISAAMCISQYGVPKVINVEMRKKAKEKLKEILDSL